MRSSRDFLRRCEELQRSGFSPEFAVGMRVARGFADLGYEVFLLLSADDMVSLLTGEVSRLQPEQRTFFFAVPECDEMVDLIQRNFFDIQNLDFVEQRSWCLRMQHVKDGSIIECRAALLEEVLCEALLRSFKHV